MHPGKEEREESRGDASLTEDENSVSFLILSDFSNVLTSAGKLNQTKSY